MVIVKSKLTGKFLRQHSGSANDFNERIRWQVSKDKKFLESLPEKTAADLSRTEYWKIETPRKKAVLKEIHRRMYNAEALEARRYAGPGMALSSIGKWVGSDTAPECRTKAERRKAHHVLPEHLEIHEIIAGNLCLVNPDDDEDTKRKQMEDCKK